MWTPVNNVVLEFCVHGGNTDAVTGYVRVRNLSFHKYVGARFTRDGWASWKEVPATFQKSDEEGRTDRFVFMKRSVRPSSSDFRKMAGTSFQEAQPSRVNLTPTYL